MSLWMREAQVRLLACNGGHKGHVLLLNSDRAGISWLYSHLS